MANERQEWRGDSTGRYWPTTEVDPFNFAAKKRPSNFHYPVAATRHGQHRALSGLIDISKSNDG